MTANESAFTPHDEHAARIASWSRYWSSGVLHSCPGSFRGNYDGAIAQFWQSAFLALKPGQRVLDIATGNGALPRLLLGLDGGHDYLCEVDAIDLAQLAPGWLSSLDGTQRARLHLHSGVMAEQLPFAEGRFDLVISQYGIEYTDLDNALIEAARVLAPHGRLCLLMHHRQALPVRKGAVEAPLIESLLAASGLLALSARMLPWIALAATADGRTQLQGLAEANADRAAFNACQLQLDQRSAEAGTDAEVLHEARAQVQQLFALVQTLGIDAARARLQQLQQHYAEHLLRARELVAHALDEERMAAIMHQLDALGFASISAQPLYYQAHLMGWTLRADR